MNRRLQQFLELEQLKPSLRQPGLAPPRTRQAPAGAEHLRSCSPAAGLLPRPVLPVHRTGP